jgi:hypothetical protein
MMKIRVADLPKHLAVTRTTLGAIAGTIAAVIAIGSAAAAPMEVALVENLTGTPAGVEFMDYLESGKVIELGSRDTIVLSYMSSCVRESITGGSVTIGTVQSEVRGGKVTRSNVPCDAGKLVLASDQTPQFGGRVFRSAPSTPSNVPPSPQITLYGRSPIVELTRSGTLLIERIDQPRERYVVELANQQLVHGKFYDFAKHGRNLALGGLYRVSWGGQELIFKIDPQAKSGNTPILGRLLRLGSPS